MGWRVSRTAHAGFVLDALEQALHERRPLQGGGLVHHSDRASQYLALRYSDRLAEAGIQPSVGSVGDSYDNALAEAINGLFKAEVIHWRGPWRSFEAVEFATLERVDWFNNPWRRARHACSNSSATCLAPRRQRTTMPRSRGQPWPPDPNQTASGRPGAVRIVAVPASWKRSPR